MERSKRIVAQLLASATSRSINNATTTEQFKYTQGQHVLSKQQRIDYERDGFVLIKGLIPVEDLETYRKHFVEVCNGDAPRAPGMTVMRDIGLAKQKDVKGEQFITKVQDFNADEVFFSYNKHPAMIPYVQDIIGEDIRAMHTMLINKPPDLGQGSSRHPAHQDILYFPFRPEERIVASWTAMQVINKQNGCLYVLPGSHKGELLKHGYPNDGIVNKAYHGIHGLTEADTEKFFWVEMMPGDTLFFHPLLIHGSGRNNTKGFRKAISCHFANSTACFYIDVAGSLQEDIAEEVKDMSSKKLGVDRDTIKYEDLWRFKSRQVVGNPKNLE